jgi:hypothetical protein
MDVFMFLLCTIGLFFSIDSAYYYYHKGLRNNLSIMIVFFLLDVYDKICDFIEGIRIRYAK